MMKENTDCRRAKVNYLEEARRLYGNDKFATEVTGVVIDEAEPERAVCSLKVEDRHLNEMGTVMGGAIFTLADFTFGVAANIGQSPTVTLTMSITYMGVCRGKRLISRAVCEKKGRTICVYSIHIEDELGTKVAVLNCTGFIKEKHDE